MNRRALCEALSTALGCGIAASAATAVGADAVDNDREGEGLELGRIVVVGSRIKRVDIETSQPVLVLEKGHLERTGLASVGDILQDLTTHGAALNTTVNNLGDGTTRVDLRNLGPERTLVLVNGRRWITGIDGGVDLNSIPLPVVERIEVLKDGASAIYGSDAIAGVINITTVDSYDGMEATAYLGEYEQGDGRVESYDFTLGASGDRASVVTNVSYFKQEPIFAGERAISVVPVVGLPPNDVYAGASPTGPNGRFGFGVRGNCPFDPSGNYPANGQCPLPPGYDFRSLNRTTYDPTTGTYRLFDPFTDGYNFAPENYLQTPQERMALYAQGRYDVTDAVTFAYEALYTERRSAQELAPFPIDVGANQLGSARITVAASHVYNPFGQAVTALSVRPGGQVRHFAQDADTFRFGSGVAGTLELGDRLWSWDANYVYGDYALGQKTEGLVNLVRLRDALGPSFLDTNGDAFCGAPGAIIPECVPFDPFHGPEALTQEMLGYIYYASQDTQHTRLWNYTANVTGEPFDLPAGPLALAAGYEYRRETGEAVRDTLRVQLNNESAGTFSGQTSVDEVYLELSIPVLSDAPFGRVLELSAAGRWSDYQTFGDTTNLKAGMRWKPADDLLLRGSWSEGFRAPTVRDLFRPGRTVLADIADDPCNIANEPNMEVLANCTSDGVPGGAYEPDAPQFEASFGGNPNLLPETSTNQTLGLVWSVPWLAGLDLSLDWYRIEIDTAISVVGPVEIVNACAIEGSSEACARTTRSPTTGQLLRVDARDVNLGAIDTEGYDLTLTYRTDTRYGRFSIVWDSTYMVEQTIEIPGFGAINFASNNATLDPTFRVRSNLDVAWERGDWSAATGVRYYSPLDEGCFVPDYAVAELCSKPDVVSAIYFGLPENRLASRTYVDLQGSWNSPWNSRITLGVNNVFDRDPPVSYTAFANSFDPAYPIPGRFFYASYSQKF